MTYHGLLVLLCFGKIQMQTHEIDYLCRSKYYSKLLINIVMDTEKQLHERSGGVCEICGAANNLSAYEVPPTQQLGADGYALLCPTCLAQIEEREPLTPNHWHALRDSMWSTVPAVQVLSWRMLHRLKAEGWTQDLLDMLYLDDEILQWAKATGEGDDSEGKLVHKDSNGAVLNAGDTVTLIKDLQVKGAGFTAKRGTAVRNISLVDDNPEQIEGRVNGQQIVLLTKYLKKSN